MAPPFRNLLRKNKSTYYVPISYRTHHRCNQTTIVHKHLRLFALRHCLSTALLLNLVTIIIYLSLLFVKYFFYKSEKSDRDQRAIPPVSRTGGSFSYQSIGASNCVHYIFSSYYLFTTDTPLALWLYFIALLVLPHSLASLSPRP